MKKRACFTIIALFVVACSTYSMEKKEKEIWSEALHGAAEKNCPSIIPKIIELGGNINATHLLAAYTLETPLMTAVRLGNSEVVKTLLAFGADSTVTDLGGEDAFSIAVRYKQTPSMSLLAAHRPDLCRQRKDDFLRSLRLSSKDISYNNCVKWFLDHAIKEDKEFFEKENFFAFYEKLPKASYRKLLRERAISLLIICRRNKIKIPKGVIGIIFKKAREPYYTSFIKYIKKLPSEEKENLYKSRYIKNYIMFLGAEEKKAVDAGSASRTLCTVF